MRIIVPNSFPATFSSLRFLGRARTALHRLSVSTALIIGLAYAAPVLAQSDAFTRSLAEAAAANESVAAFYRMHGYQPLWTGPQDQARRHALMMAFATAQGQGLPTGRYDPAALIAQAKAAVTEGDRGRLEMAMTTAYLAYARDVSSGALTPKKIDPTILREIPRPDQASLLAAIAAAPVPET